MTRLAFPFGVNALGQGAGVAYGSDAHVRHMLELLIFTMPDERVMRPDLGSPVRQMVHAGSGGPVAIALEAALQSSIQQWLGSVMTLLDLRVSADGPEGVLDISITYEVKASRMTGDLPLRKELT
jgi:phage baseplate assembly protein W